MSLHRCRGERCVFSVEDRVPTPINERLLSSAVILDWKGTGYTASEAFDLARGM